MASVDKTVRGAIIAYPMLHSNRTEVLHYILCVIGNDFTWRNGEAVLRHEDDRVLADPDGPVIEQFEENYRRSVEYTTAIYSDNPRSLDAMLQVLESDRVESLEILHDLDNRVQDWAPLEREVYPQTEYALLMNIPENVTKDWKEACERMKSIVSQKGWEF